MKLKVSTIILASFIAQSTFAANNLQTKPEVCPSVSALQSVGVNKASDGALGGWLAMNSKNNYGTAYEWSFAVLVGPAANEAEAIKLANSEIKTMTYIQGPEERAEGTNEWGCLYMTSDENQFIGFAVTPAVDSMKKFAYQYKH